MSISQGQITYYNPNDTPSVVSIFSNHHKKGYLWIIDFVWREQKYLVSKETLILPYELGGLKMHQ